MGLQSEARAALVEAARAEPCHWGAWLELSSLVTDAKKLDDVALALPHHHWMRHFFLAHTYLELQLNQRALDVYFALQNGGMAESTYLLAQVCVDNKLSLY